MMRELGKEYRLPCTESCVSVPPDTHVLHGCRTEPL